GHRHDDPAWFAAAQRRDGGPHAGAGRQAVIDEDGYAASDLDRRPAVAVLALAPLQVFQFHLGDTLDDIRWNPQRLDDALVEDSNPSGGNGAHGQFLMPRHAELTYQKHI